MQTNTAKRILILGSGPDARALAQVLRSLTQSDFTLSDNTSVFDPSRSLSGEETETYRKKLRNYEAVICFPGFAGRPTEIVRVIRRLRTSLRWEGHFLSLVLDSEVEDIREASLTGDPAEQTCFKNVPAHTALAEPVQLPRLLSLLQEPQHLASERWFLDLLKTSSLQKLSDAVEKSHAVVKKGQKVTARKATSDALSLIGEVDWLLVTPASIYHDQKIRKRVEKLTDRQSRTASLTLRECSKILEEIEELLSHTSV